MHSASRKQTIAYQPPAHKQYQRQSLLPPLNETSFSEQYKTFKELGGFGGVFAARDLDMGHDLEMRLKPSVQNRPFIKR